MAFPNSMTEGLSSGIWGASIPGAENASLAGPPYRDTLFLTQFGGEIARFFKQNLVFANSVTKMQFRGKSIQLPYFHRAQVGFQTSGYNIMDPANGLLTSVRGADRFLYPDKPMVNAVFVNEWDELISHLPTRMIYAQELGEAQAVAVDSLLARCIAAGAAVAADAIYTGHPGGNVVTAANGQTTVIGYDISNPNGYGSGAYLPTAANLAAAIKKLRVSFDEKNVPKMGRKLALSPKNYQLICDNKDLFDVDYTPGGNGTYAGGEMRGVYGFELVVTTNGPFNGNTWSAPSSTAGSKTAGNFTLALGDNAAASSQVFSAGGFAGSGVANGAASQAAITAARTNQQASTEAGNSYTLNASKLVALAWAPKAVVMGTLRGLKLETKEMIEYGGSLVKLSQINGATYWYPEACGAIYNGADHTS